MTERLQDMEAVKEYLRLLEMDGEMKYMALPFLNIFRDMDLLKSKMGMVSEEMDSVQKKAAVLQDGSGKDYALCALHAAEEGTGAAWDCFSRAESVIVQGVEKSAAGFRNGRGRALEKPFPISKVEKELEEMMKALIKPFAAVDRAIGRIEAAGGLHCEDGHYRTAADTKWREDGVDKSVLPGVLWPLRSLEELIGQAYDVAYGTACRVNDMRTKGHRIIKRDLLTPGFYWEKQREALEMKQREEPFAEEKGRPSLRKRMEELKVASPCPGYMPQHEKKQKAVGMQR